MSTRRYRLCIRLANGSIIRGIFHNTGQARLAAREMYQDQAVQSIRVEDLAGTYQENIERCGSTPPPLGSIPGDTRRAACR
jgi:hypothetical protein